MLRFILSFLTSGPLDRILDSVDRKIAGDAYKQKVKGDIVQEYYRQRGDWMRSGGFWLMLLFSAPLAFWFGAVCIYSVFWCAGCAYPQDWTIAALPSPLDEWAGSIIISIFGVIGLSRLRMWK